jgi:methylmalonyl-CoA/ethylmalonyl-CoA epimerase
MEQDLLGMETSSSVAEPKGSTEQKTKGLPSGLRFKLLHVGVAVAEIEPAAEMFANLFGSKVISGPFDDPIQRVTVNFLTQTNAPDADAAEIELIAPLNAEAPIHSMLKKTGGGAYHLCFETNDLERALAHLAEHRCLMVSAPAPAVAFEGRRIAWLYTPTRLLVELVERTDG